MRYLSAEFFFILALPNFKCGFAASGPLEDIALRVLRVLQSETMEAALMGLGWRGIGFVSVGNWALYVFNTTKVTRFF